MDPSKFDELTKALATSTSRRQALKTIAATTLGSILGLGGIGTAFAKCKGPGHQCSKDEHCCSNVCCNRVCCPSGQVCQNGQCVTPCTANGGTCSVNSDCCSGTCCNGVCCPSGDVCRTDHCTGVCGNGQDACGNTPTCNNNPNCFCYKNFDGSSLCAGGGTCTSCASDADCVAKGFAFCVPAVGGCCVAGTACVSACP